MIRIPFTKVESIGNDFVLVHLDEMAEAGTFLSKERNREQSGGGQACAVCEPAVDFLSHLAVHICERRFGVGSDGLLAVGKEGDAIRLRMFNPDGSEDFCGNGLRCTALHANRLGMAGDEMTIRHLNQEVLAEVLPDGRIKTLYGHADYAPDNIPVHFLEDPERTFDRPSLWDGTVMGRSVSLSGSALTTGSTHVVIPVDKLPDDDLFLAASPHIENRREFPERTSVIWSHETAPMSLEIRIWERGAGETLGCGTGSSAAAADYLRRKGTGGTVAVHNKGGAVEVSIPTWDGSITAVGTAHEHFSGEYLLREP
jgi:diaminopimelate epimerase